MIVGERYIGKAEIKNLDKEGTKLGAFLEIDFEELSQYMKLRDMSTVNTLDKVRFKVLPNKREDGYTLKVNITEEVSTK